LDPSENQIQEAIDAQGTAVTNKLQKQLDIQNQILSGKMTMKQLEIERLQVEHGMSEEAAEQAYELKNQIEAIQLLRDVMSQLGEDLLKTGISSTIDMMHELGQAFQDGAISSDEMSSALRNMVKRIIDSLPQMLLQAGLQLLIAGQWIAGLGLIGASGLMGFVSGLTDSAKDDSNKDDYERLKKISDQITDLINQQREQAEYYLIKRRELNASVIRAGITGVNDMIITPQGNFSTNPNDFIIATKHPETLGSNEAAPVYINIINNSTSTVTAQEETDQDGTRKIVVMVDQLVQNGLATGKYDGAIAAGEQRRRGRSLST
jgi:hypothetical protein